MEPTIIRLTQKSNPLTIKTNDGWDLNFFEGQYGPCIAGTFMGGQKKYLSITPEQKESLTPEMMKTLWSQKFLGIQDGDVIEYCVGRYGGYLKWKGKNYNCPTRVSTISEAMDVIQKRESNPKSSYSPKWRHEDETFEYVYGEGQYGPYIRIKHKANGVTKFVSWRSEDGELSIENLFKKLQNQ